MKTTLIYLHCLCATLLVNSASAAGRVFHEDFETGTLAQWKSEGAEMTTNSVHSGRYALRCNWDGTVPWNSPKAKTGLDLDR